MTSDTPRAPAVEGFALGPYATNCYVVRSPTDEDQACCWIADVGYDPAPMLDHVEREGLRPQAIVLTHAHPDHIAGLKEARRRFPNAPIWIHEAEAEWLTDPMLNLSALLGQPVTAPPPDRLIADGEILTLCRQPWRVAHTPGHSPGGISLIHEPSRQAIVGDALFAGSIGRTDFPGGSLDVLARSIRERLYTLPPETVVYPGHGPETTIGRERASNPFVRG